MLRGMHVDSCQGLLDQLMPPRVILEHLPGYNWNGTCTVRFILSRKKIRVVAIFDAADSSSPASGEFQVRFHNAEVSVTDFEKTRDSLRLVARMSGLGYTFTLVGFNYHAEREIDFRRMPSMFVPEY